MKQNKSIIRLLALLVVMVMSVAGILVACDKTKKPVDPTPPANVREEREVLKADASKLMRFTESWRSVKPNGWAIVDNGDEAKIKRAVALFDYMYSQEGNTLMSYGPADWIDGTILYGGKSVPKLSDAALNELQYYAGGNYTNYYRRFLGGTFPIGYVKEQGMEYQTVHDKGKVGLENLLRAIELGTVEHLHVVGTNQIADKSYHAVPATFAYTNTQLAWQTQYSATANNVFNITSSRYDHPFSPFIVYGFGYKEGDTTTESMDDYLKLLKEGEGYLLSQHLEMAQKAFDTTVVPKQIPTVGSSTSYPLTDNVELNLAVWHDKNSRIKFNQEGTWSTIPESHAGDDNYKGYAHDGIDKKYAAADGTRYGNGDIKPVWKELSSRLNFTIKDAASLGNFDSQNDGWTKMINDKFKDADGNPIDIVTASGDRIIERAVTDGTFVNLKEHLDKMPNFRRFLLENPIVADTITAADGQIFYAPYFDGYDDLERMFMMRVDMVEKLLDGDELPAFDTTTVQETLAYTKYMPDSMDQEFTVVKADGSATTTVKKTYTKNIIDIQNDLEVKNGENLAKALRDYIDATYKDAEGNSFYGNKRSELFTGINAAYDADELVALMRAIKCNPNLLVGAGNQLCVFYPRGNNADRVADLVRLAQIWGVRGLESRNGFYFLDSEGKLYDARIEKTTYLGLAKLNELYKEGLILQNYHTETTSDRKDKIRSEWNTVAKQGFMTYDYNQTTTVFNSMGDGESPKIPGYNLTPVLPPFADWTII